MWKVTRRLDPCDSRPQLGSGVPVFPLIHPLSKGAAGLPIMEGETDREPRSPHVMGLSISTSNNAAEPSLPRRACEPPRCKARVVSMWRQDGVCASSSPSSCARLSAICSSARRPCALRARDIYQVSKMSSPGLLRLLPLVTAHRTWQHLQSLEDKERSPSREPSS